MTQEKEQEKALYPWLNAMLAQWTLRANEQKLAHAWIFSGPSGIGKSAFVHHLSKHILASDAPNQQHQIKWVEANTHPDFMIIAPSEKGHISIERIREATEFLAYTPVVGKYKVINILQAEKMLISAQSALLKTLEEPAGHAYLFLTAENSSQLLATIRSRCQKQVIPLPSMLELDAWLKTQTIFSSEQLSWVKKLANNAPDLTLSLLPEELIEPSLPLLLYLVSIIASNWQVVPGLREWVHHQLGLFLPNYIFHPKTQADKQLKIEFYRYICELIQKIHLCSSINAKLLLYSIEHFDGSNKIKLK